jgi:hypothetical protein
MTIISKRNDGRILPVQFDVSPPGNAQVLFFENPIDAFLFKWSRSKLLFERAGDRADRERN